MSMIVETAVVHEIDAETIISPTATGRLLLDSSDTGGALSTIRMTLADGADGAVPHHLDRKPYSPSDYAVTGGPPQIFTAEFPQVGSW
ncbi:hypothetical protein LDL08_33960 [Nonomuraea glycinis]|uniref:Uncharacterized protein n=1 Tax=Nonomuraea glycinis TaxID=2047744 RepID=A0A918E9J1_9ACTN|nr:hypothetical protein [Nonomuraea glycinis]MCA2181190.1 hypothetical protein [Nonomuraea glycinis]GGP13479.1 hypothetical protein GCM10012278_65410 [Nonomuraea glycinis]